MTDQLPPKPGRTTTKRITFAVVLNAFLLPYVALYAAPDQFGVAVGAAVSMIALALGIYQGAGHADLRAILGQRRENLDIGSGYGESSRDFPSTGGTV